MAKNYCGPQPPWDALDTLKSCSAALFFPNKPLEVEFHPILNLFGQSTSGRIERLLIRRIAVDFDLAANGSFRVALSRISPWAAAPSNCPLVNTRFRLVFERRR